MSVPGWGGKGGAAGICLIEAQSVFSFAFCLLLGSGCEFCELMFRRFRWQLCRCRAVATVLFRVKAWVADCSV